MSRDDDRWDEEDSGLRMRAQLVRRSMDELSASVYADGHASMALLEEQMASMGASCPAVLLEAHDAVTKSSRDVATMLEGCRDGIVRTLDWA